MKSLKESIFDSARKEVSIPTFKSKKEIISWFEKYLKPISDNESYADLFSVVNGRNCYISFTRETGFSDYLIININEFNGAPSGFFNRKPNKTQRDNQKLAFNLSDNKIDSFFMSSKFKDTLVSDFKNFLDVDFTLPIDTESKMLSVINDCIEAFDRMGAKWKVVRA